MVRYSHSQEATYSSSYPLRAFSDDPTEDLKGAEPAWSPKDLPFFRDSYYYGFYIVSI